VREVRVKMTQFWCNPSTSNPRKKHHKIKGDTYIIHILYDQKSYVTNSVAAINKFSTQKKGLI
jgi:hypothetical protein